jgi:hypothetical protein
MITGFRSKVEYLLRRRGMRNGIGYVPNYSYKLRKYLKLQGFTIEDKFPDHTVDFIYLPKREATRVPEALTKLNIGGIIVLSLGIGEIKEIRKGYE